MGDGRANNITARWSDYIYPYTNFTETALSPGLEDAWGSFYSVIAQANYTINNIKDYSSPQISEEAKTQAFCRSTLHAWACLLVYRISMGKRYYL